MNTEILTVKEVAAMLKMSTRAINEMKNPRTRSGDIRTNPLPAFKVGKCVRFRKSDVEAWIEKLAGAGHPLR